jgi:hypothetical protein
MNEENWLIHFLEMCSFVERCDYVIAGLQNAISLSEPWDCHINEIVLRYDPSESVVTAEFDWDDPPTPSTMNASVFFTMLHEKRALATILERLKDAPTRLVVLTVCGIARTVEHLLTDHRSSNAIETAERFADGQAIGEEVSAAEEATRTAKEAANEAFLTAINTAGATVRAAEATARAAGAARWAVVAAVRTTDIGKAAGWAALAAPAAAWSAGAAGATDKSISSILDCLLAPRIHAPFPAHVKGLAATIYEKRDWSLMPVIADALEAMGLEGLALHCRQSIHAKGCHVLDSILGNG